jgi:ABC-type transporter Mla subunit MlaD
VSANCFKTIIQIFSINSSAYKHNPLKSVQSVAKTLRKNPKIQKTQQNQPFADQSDTFADPTDAFADQLDAFADQLDAFADQLDAFAEQLDTFA